MSGPTISQKFTAEVIGTAILVFIGAGSVPLTVFLTGENPFGSAQLSTISFAFAFAIFAAVYSVGHISGAHINPAVTLALLATKRIDTRTAGVYIVAQVIGATLGALLTYVILIGNDPVTLGLGAVSYNEATSGIAIALVAEIIGTAILVFTVFGAAVDGRAPAGFAGIVIGFIVYGIIILVGPITGAALNPARQLGPELVETIIGSATNWGQMAVYIAGPIIGGIVGALLYDLVGHTRTSDVPGPAVAEAAHAEA